MNYYDILNLSDYYTEQELKEKYRKLVKKYHPDVNKDVNTDKIKEINSAYEIAIKNIPKIKKVPEPKNRNVYIDMEVTLNDLITQKTEILNYTIQDNRVNHVEIKLSPKMKFGDKLVFKKKGFSEYPNQDAGDLVVTLVLSEEDCDKTITDLDVMITHKISYLDILIGNTVIKTLDGKKIKVNLTDMILDTRRIRLEGKGIPSKNKKGDLYIDLELSKLNLTDDEKNALAYIRNNL